MIPLWIKSQTGGLSGEFSFQPLLFTSSDTTKLNSTIGILIGISLIEELISLTSIAMQI